MIYQPPTTNTVTLRSDDSNFWIHNQFTLTARASIEISNKCPREYKMIIAECINNGWINPVANLSERELLFLGLSNERSNSTTA